MCTAHNHRAQRGQDMLAPIREATRTQLDEQGRKQCLGCDEWLALDQFATYVRRGVDSVRGRCVTCLRVREVGRVYNLAGDVFLKMIADGCAICGADEGLSLAVDHDHACCRGAVSCGTCVRGVLCADCNVSIGRMRDDPARLRAAADYLER